MGLQWLILTYVVATEAAVAILLTLPTPKLLRNRFASLVSLILQPALFIVPFAGFHLLDLYWKNEHRLMCTSEVCTAAERDRYEKSVYQPHLQVSEGNPESGGSGEENQGPVDSFSHD
ncbi:hypothetical protein JHK85_026043 [Glycine max]|nr:hypothetical protein JHK85_026043 [Glycine max]